MRKLGRQCKALTDGMGFAHALRRSAEIAQLFHTCDKRGQRTKGRRRHGLCPWQNPQTF
jgi:hypothetical protein